MRPIRPICPTPLVLLLALLAPSVAGAREIHVSNRSGNDKNDGLKAASPLKTIPAAAKMAKPGDEVILQPGVYYHWRTGIPCRGTENQPIVFRADETSEGRVVITAADPSFREGKAKWTLVDKKLGLYSAPYDTAKRGRPSRVLYSGTDLYPYDSLEHLKVFICKGDTPGPKHGFFYDAEKSTLYVRLYAGGKYGAADPAKHVMSVSPKEGQCLKLTGEEQMNVVFDGITFETSGQSAVGLEGSHVTLRRCWFKGCIGAIRGGSHVTIEYCDFTHFPAYDDATETLREKKISASNVAPKHNLIWQRKHRDHGCATQDYEDGGLALSMKEGWIIRHNLVHDCFEGLAGSGMTRSVGAKIHDNIFARICDNAIETESARERRSHLQEPVRRLSRHNLVSAGQRPALAGTDPVPRERHHQHRGARRALAVFESRRRERIQNRHLAEELAQRQKRERAKIPTECARAGSVLRQQLGLSAERENLQPAWKFKSPH